MTSEQVHVLTIIGRPKMDAPNLVAARCSCGYQSAPGDVHSVTKAWAAHYEAKTETRP